MGLLILYTYVMQNLIDFIVKYKYWFVFLLLEGFSLSLLFRFNNYQGSVFFTNANSMVGGLYNTVNGVTSYVNLGEVNAKLESDNELLRAEIHEMKRILAEHRVDTLRFNGFNRGRFRFIGAQVINATLHQGNNTITINKGQKDGIKPEMGVICSSGVVGIVYLTSDHYSIVIPVINASSKVSCRLGKSNHFGTLQWHHGDPEHAQMIGVPLHVKIKKGQLIETNGFSDIFPSSIPIGRVEDVEPSQDGLSHLITVKLSTDFNLLQNVSVITNYSHAEKRLLEQKADSLLEGNDEESFY